MSGLAEGGAPPSALSSLHAKHGSNRVTFAVLMTMLAREGGADDAAKVLQAATVEDLAELSAGHDEARGLIGRVGEMLHAEADRRFADAAREARAAEGKDAGTVRLAVDGYVIVADLPKKVEWNQPKLAALWTAIGAAGDKPGEYMRVEYKVSEKAYGAWPSFLREKFEPARTVRTGKAAYSFEKAEAKAE